MTLPNILMVLLTKWCDVLGRSPSSDMEQAETHLQIYKSQGHLKKKMQAHIKSD